MATSPDKAGNPDNAGHSSFAQVVDTWSHWWRNAVVNTVDQVEVIANRREECQLSARYLFMLAMSAGIAILGLLLSSPAVVIGAMLLSPLMGPIIGLGFALATGDYVWMRQAAKALALGTAMSVALCALVVLLSPLQTVTAEIAARTRPNLFDLAVAFFSALAGAYAMIRGREGTVVGVAIATALMPPLAVVGFGLATWNGAVFWGALGLFVTNLLTIALTAWFMARLYGFRSRLSERQNRLQTAAVVAVFVAMSVPLAISLNRIVWETRSSQKIRSEVMDAFDNRAVLSEVQIDWDAEPIRISATVFTPQLQPDAEGVAERAIAREIARDVDVTIIQSKVGPDKDAAEAAQLAAARANKEAADRQRAEQLGEGLSLVAGVDESAVVIDRQNRRALVTARPLEGLGLAGYRELEARVARTEPEWSIELKPPARPLPRVAFDKGEPTKDGQDALALIGWAAQRIGVPVILSGTDAETATAAEVLGGQGVVTRRETGGDAGTVTARWAAPDQ
ncbi:DUF389 domain-containing protein [Erythrobacter sp. SG61-1L]|uniref:DUF389 domain-containing protein n=1 Tax=Erythrobacter sp. SG61-1L TaxID=1603897 RepID=UPI0006C8EE54|nr:DUF389 domain-containing protein [Erythrobacter sp. SG61-1L]